MISFIVPFTTYEKDKFLNLNKGFEYSNVNNTVFSTFKTIKSINSLKCEKEILLIDNSNTFPNVSLPNLRVIKGFQYQKIEDLMKNPKFTNHTDIDYAKFNLGNDTMWASMAFHLGIQEAKGEYVVLQHNDVFYHRDCIDEMIQQMEKDELQYISVDNKKISLSTYIVNSDRLNPLITKNPTDVVLFGPENGGYVKTQIMGFADAYFFLSKKSFFDKVDVDWNFGDTNHGSTVYCLENNLKYLHLGPYWDNPNWDTTHSQLHTYDYNEKPFLTHLKGGFSENKMVADHHDVEYQRYMSELQTYEDK